ncbi:MAG: hypothetical protein J0H17_02480 [Rhizobiales bacterium]|jgi:hypothetical protein|nr:hypothetical protein [Hyphomicrobiales bacterium]
MLLKFIAFVAAALPIIMFLRRLMAGGKRPTRLSEGVKEFKKQFDLAVWIFLALVGAIFAFAAGKLAWTWWNA